MKINQRQMKATLGVRLGFGHLVQRDIPAALFRKRGVGFGMAAQWFIGVEVEYRKDTVASQEKVAAPAREGQRAKSCRRYCPRRGIPVCPAQHRGLRSVDDAYIGPVPSRELVYEL
jgi:hypothetical protein